jgi:hypothetical protein
MFHKIHREQLIAHGVAGAPQSKGRTIIEKLPRILTRL